MFLGDKQLETTYVWPELILVRDVARDTYRKEKDTLSVKQVGKDKVPLGGGTDPAAMREKRAHSHMR